MFRRRDPVGSRGSSAAAPVRSSSVERLRGLDTAFLYLETPTNHLHVAWAAVLDTREAPTAASPGCLCELIRRRLHLLPALRKRLADPRLGYTQPDWIDVDVDPADHCTVHRQRRSGSRRRRRAGPSPRPPSAAVGDARRRGAARRPYRDDHEAPPCAARWPVGGRVDGAAARSRAGSGRLRRRPAALTVDPQPTRAELDRVARRRASRAAPRAAAEMRNAVDVLTATQRWDRRAPRRRRARHLSAPRTRFNQPITARTFGALHRCPARRPRQGPTRHWLDGQRRGAGDHRRRAAALPPSPRAPCPTRPCRRWCRCRHATSTSTTGGNQPLGADHDAGHQHRRPAGAVDPGHSGHQRRQASARRHWGRIAVGLLDVVPPRAGQDWPASPAACASPGGARCPSTWSSPTCRDPMPPSTATAPWWNRRIPMGPITDWSAINVTVVSYRRHLAFGLVACPDVVPDIDELRDDVDAEIDALVTAACRHSSQRSGARVSGR